MKEENRRMKHNILICCQLGKIDIKNNNYYFYFDSNNYIFRYIPVIYDLVRQARQRIFSSTRF